MTQNCFFFVVVVGKMMHCCIEISNRFLSIPCLIRCIIIIFFFKFPFPLFIRVIRVYFRTMFYKRKELVWLLYGFNSDERRIRFPFEKSKGLPENQRCAVFHGKKSAIFRVLFENRNFPVAIETP